MNGGCEHVCLPSATAQATCKCDFGFILESDRKNCSSGKHFLGKMQYISRYTWYWKSLFFWKFLEFLNYNFFIIRRPERPVHDNSGPHTRQTIPGIFIGCKNHRSGLSGSIKTGLCFIQQEYKNGVLGRNRESGQSDKAGNHWRQKYQDSDGSRYKIEQILSLANLS